MTKFYRPIRDDAVEALNKTSHSKMAQRAAAAPVYVVSDILPELESVFSYLSGYEHVALVSEMQRVASNFRPPADEFFIEYTKDGESELGAFVMKASDHYGIFVYLRNGRQLWAENVALLINSEKSFLSRFNKPSITGNIGGKFREIDNHSDDKVAGIYQKAAEVVFAFAQILTAKNVTADLVPYTPKQRREFSRKTGGKRNPPSYRTLKINRPKFIKLNKDDDGEEDGTEENKIKRKRRHVRGHFRTYRAARYSHEVRGTYWISPFWRGDETLGTITTPIILKSA